MCLVWGAIGSLPRKQVPKATEIPTSESGVNGTKVSLMTQTKLWARREEKNNQLCLVPSEGVSSYSF